MWRGSCTLPRLSQLVAVAIRLGFRVRISGVMTEDTVNEVNLYVEIALAAARPTLRDKTRCFEALNPEHFRTT